MATLTPGGYTWGGVHGGEDRYSRIVPANRTARINRLARQGKNLGGGRSNLDAARGRSWQGVTTPRFAQQTYGGGEGRGGQGNIYRPSGVHPGGAGITASQKGQNYITRTTDDEDQAAFDHRATAHFKPWFADVMEKFGGLTEGALRGSRLHSSYKDAAVAAGGTKAEGSKAWEADKRAMMTGEDKAFYDKYMNLADMATDNEKAQEYRDTAETAWRNKQTSDRLAAASGFEDYLPDKYINKRYTGSHPRAGDLVPGVGRMQEVAGNLGFGGWYPGEGTGRSMAEGRDAIASQMNVAPGFDYSDPDEIFEDITADLGGEDYTPYPDEKWKAPVMTPSMLDDLYETGEMMPDEQYSTWGEPGFYNERSRFGGWNNMDRKFADLSLRNSGFVGPFTRKGGLPFEPNVGMGYVDDLTVNPNLIPVNEEDEDKKYTGRLGLYD